MSTIYFTNNANSGAGSLRAAVAAAQEGDVITPDPTVFNADELVEITLNTGIETTVGLTLSAGKTRLRLKRSNNSGDRVLYAKTEAAYFHAEDVEFIGRIIAYTPEAVFRRCRVYGNRSDAPGIGGHAGSKISVYDCVVAGCRGAGLYNAGANSATTIVRSTVAGNAQTVFSGSSTVVTKIDSIVDPVCSEAGFVAPPPDVVDVSETGVAIDWSGWDFRLLPTSPYATGATSAAGEYDVDGNPRGRLATNASENTESSGSSNPEPGGSGATLYAVGAYELVVADYYQASASPASFNDPNGWTTDPARTTPPESITSGVFYLDESAAWLDAPPAGSTLIVAGRRVETFDADLALARLETGRNSTLVFSGVDRVVSARDASMGAGATLAAPPGSSGYLAVPTGVDVSGTTREGVVVAGLGAEIRSFSATSERPGRATLRWTARNGSETVRVERRVGAGSWVEVAATVPASEETFAATQGNGRATFRAFDGENFWTDDAWSSVGVQFRVVANAVPGERVAQLWKAEATVVATSDSVKVGQGITILAQIVDAFDESALLLSDGSNVQSVTYACYYVSNGLFEETLTPVAGHENVVVSNDCVLEAPQRSDAWTRDEIGYTFALTPDVRTAPLFEKPGEYQIKVVIRLTVGNPVTFYVPITVVGS